MANAADEKFMQQTLALASKGAGRVSPNPLVGSVIVRNNKIIAKGFHARFGSAHAEAIALKRAGAKARGATLYVNIEPCVMHTGKKTPSCAEAIARAGVKRVIAAMRDPNPRVSGRGFELLRKASVAVEAGVLENEAQELNEPYAKFVSTRKPFVLLKMAVSLDGKIASSKVKQISNEKAMRFVHQLRNQYDAIMVGVGTVLADNPRLTCRLRGGRDPLRVVIDSQLRSPLSARAFADNNAIAFAAAGANKEKKLLLEKKGIRVFEAGEREVDLRKALGKLGELAIASVLVEGGSKIATALLKQKLVDKCVFIVAPKILGEGVPLAGDVGGEIILKNARVRALGDNAVFEGYPL